MPERVCPFTGCGVGIDAEMFACKRHWFSLPNLQQRRILVAYKLWRVGEIDGAELRRRQQEVLDQTREGGHA